MDVSPRTSSSPAPSAALAAVAHSSSESWLLANPPPEGDRLWAGWFLQGFNAGIPEITLRNQMVLGISPTWTNARRRAVVKARRADFDLIKHSRSHSASQGGVFS